MDEHGGNIYRYGKDIIDFSANINPLGLNKGIKKALRNSLNGITHYPDPDSRDLLKSIARYWKIKEENILLGNGSSELIYLVMNTFRPRKVFIPFPAFSEYERAAKTIKDVRGRSLHILFICNPNNPTGSLVRIPARRGGIGLRVIDETFMDFVPDEDKHTMIWKAAKSRGIIVLRTFTKFFAIPGLRLGYLVAHRDLVKIMKGHQVPWNINSLSQAAGIMLRDKEYIKKTRSFVKREREFLFKELSGIEGFKPFPSVTNFILVKIDGITSTILKERLIRKGILIRDCSNFRGLNNKFIRVAVRKRSENIRLIEALKYYDKRNISV